MLDTRLPQNISLFKLQKKDNILRGMNFLNLRKRISKGKFVKHCSSLWRCFYLKIRDKIKKQYWNAIIFIFENNRL